MRLLDKFWTVLKKAKATPQKGLIEILNPIIRGWVNFHHQIVAKRTFNQVDHQIWEGMWNWTKRCHPKKRDPWNKKHNFQGKRFESWIFSSSKDQDLS